MERIEFRASSRRDAECLERELAGHAPHRSGLAVSVEFDGSTSSLFALLSAAETCLRENGIGGVRVEVAGSAYLLAPQTAS
jgi:hypothetical protein